MKTKRRFIKNIIITGLLFKAFFFNFSLNLDRKIKIIKYKNSYWVLDSED
jgi:hypothetical protein